MKGLSFSTQKLTKLTWYDFPRHFFSFAKERQFPMTHYDDPKWRGYRIPPPHPPRLIVYVCEYQ